MNWEALGAVAELLGAIGVIATLVYLSAQIRHNNDQLRGAATTAVYEYQRTLTEMLSADRELYDGKVSYWLKLHSSPGRREWWYTHSVMLSADFYADV